MKKIIAFALVLACLFVLVSCGGNEVDDVAAMYENSNPTKIVITTSQKFSSHELKGEYTLITGYSNGKNAALYVEVYDRMRNVEEGATDVIVDVIETVSNKYEYLEDKGVRTNGGSWVADQESFVQNVGAIALNLSSKLVNKHKYEDNKLSCVVPAKNTAEVLGLEANLSVDATLEILDDGASVNLVSITYTIPANEASGVEETVVTINAVYTYNLEQITID